MPDYKELYFELFNKITDVIETLKDAQIETEESVICGKNIENDLQ